MKGSTKSEWLVLNFFSPPAGECWYHIPSPPKQTLRQLSVGRTSVFAVDENGEERSIWAAICLIKREELTFSLKQSGNLWYRQGLTPSYPQGSAWELISNNVTKVSVGPLDQVGGACGLLLVGDMWSEGGFFSGLDHCRWNSGFSCWDSGGGLPSVGGGAHAAQGPVLGLRHRGRFLTGFCCFSSFEALH